MDTTQQVLDTLIFEAAIAQINRSDAPVSMETVAAELCVSSQVVIKQMDSVEALLSRSFVHFLKQTFETITPEVGDDELLPQVLRSHAHWLHANLQTVERFQSRLIAHQISIASVNTRFKTSPGMLITSMLTQFFVALQKRGIMASTDALEVANTFFAAVGHHVRQGMNDPGFRTHTPVAAYLDGVCARLIDSASKPGVAIDALPLEIERKYLLGAMPDLSGLSVGHVWEIEQGYIPGASITERIRRAVSGSLVKCTRTVKLGSGVRRIEFEDEIEHGLFEKLWGATIGRRVTKERFVVSTHDGVWELDKFTDRNLVLLEIELSSEHEEVHMPEAFKAVLVREVTEDKKFTNWALSRNNGASSVSN